MDVADNVVVVFIEEEVVVVFVEGDIVIWLLLLVEDIDVTSE